MWSAAATALAASACEPPSLNESGVTLSTPQTEHAMGPRRAETPSPLTARAVFSPCPVSLASSTNAPPQRRAGSRALNVSTSRRNLTGPGLEDGTFALLARFVALVGVGGDDHLLTRRHGTP